MVDDYIGGLVGQNSRGFINASAGGTIVSSYSTGDANGGGGDGDAVGGLVGIE